MTNVDVINTTVSNSSACHSKMDDDGDWSWTRVMAGTILAMTVQLMSGISIAVRKKALTAVALSGARPAGEGGLGYLKSKLWWLGFIMLVICQAAYGVSISLTSAVVAAPMAVLSIAGSAIGGRVIVKDWIGPFGWMGCVILMSGCAIFAISAPVDIDLATADEVNKLFTSINFISFVVVIVIIDTTLIVLSSKFGFKHILLFAFLVGSSACIGFWFTKGIGVYIMVGAFMEWPLWVALVCQAFLAFFNVYYSNVHTDNYIASHSAATAYVVFSTLVIVCATGFFPIKMNISLQEGFLLGLSFIIIVVSLFVLTVGKYIEFDFKILVQQNNMVPQPQPALEHSSSTQCYDNESVPTLSTDESTPTIRTE